MGKSKHYIDNKRFEYLIKLYLKNPSSCEDELFKLFDLLISNIITGFNFRVEAEDAKQDCFILVLETLTKFKPSKGSAFNYFTTVIINRINKCWKDENRYREKINNYISRMSSYYNPSSL